MEGTETDTSVCDTCATCDCATGVGEEEVADTVEEAEAEVAA